MASIQIREIETPMEELSYDASGNITGGFNAEDLSILIQQILDFSGDTVRETLQTVKEIFLQLG